MPNADNSPILFDYCSTGRVKGAREGREKLQIVYIENNKKTAGSSPILRPAISHSGDSFLPPGCIFFVLSLFSIHLYLTLQIFSLTISCGIQPIPTTEENS